MGIDHRFQTPHVEPLVEPASARLLLRVTSADVRRIIGALEAVSPNLSGGPSPSDAAAACRRLAADLRIQVAAGPDIPCMKTDTRLR
jgi:tRNA A37 threonylcarbamoyladenosine synthetase subunit TsaC/SUA5/YrdC